MTDKQRQHALFVRAVCIDAPTRAGNDAEQIRSMFLTRYGIAEKLTKLQREYERIQTRKCNEPYPEWERDLSRVKGKIIDAVTSLGVFERVECGVFGLALVESDGRETYVQ